MRKILLILLAAGTAFALPSYQGWCEQGGQTITTAGMASVTKAQVSYPGCTVTLFPHGSATPVASGSVFSDNSGTVLGNPFTADSHGHFSFFVANGHYDVQLSGTIPTWTTWDVLLADPNAFGAVNFSNIAGTVALGQLPALVDSFNARTGPVVPTTGDYTAAMVTHALDSTQSYSDPAWLTGIAAAICPTCVTTDTAQVLTGTKTFNGTVFVGSNEVIDASGFSAWGGASLNDSTALGYVVSNIDHTWVNQDNESRGVSSVVRASRSTTDEPNYGWDQFGIAGVVQLQAMTMPTDPHYCPIPTDPTSCGTVAYIRGQQKAVDSELYYSASPNAYTANIGMNYLASLATVGSGVTVNTWAGLIVGQPGGFGGGGGHVVNGYGVWIQNLLDANAILTSASTAAIEIEGLGTYGRIWWTCNSVNRPCPASSIYSPVLGTLEFSADTQVQTATGVGFKAGGSAANAGIAAGSYAVGGTTIIDGSLNISTTGYINTSSKFEISGVTAIDSNRNGSFVNLGVSGSTSLLGYLTIEVTGMTQCLHVNSLGVVSGTGADCGSGGGGGGGGSSFPGSVTANTSLTPLAGFYVGSTGIIQYASGLPSPAGANIGNVYNIDAYGDIRINPPSAAHHVSSGTDAANGGYWLGTTQIITGAGVASLLSLKLTGTSTTGVVAQCLHVDTSGNITGTGADCGSGGGGGGGGGSYSCIISGVASQACVHDLDTSTPLYQCYGTSGITITTATPVGANELDFVFSGAFTGSCLISSGSGGGPSFTGSVTANTGGTNGAGFFVDTTGIIQCDSTGCATISAGNLYNINAGGDIVTCTRSETAPYPCVSYPHHVDAGSYDLAGVEIISSIGQITTNVTGSVQCLHVNSSGVISGTGSDCGSGGGGGTPGGSNGQIQYNNGGVFGGFTAGGDLTFSVPNFTLATVNSGSGACGDSTHVCAVTTNAKGLVTSQSAVAISGGSGGNPFTGSVTANTSLTNNAGFYINNIGVIQYSTSLTAVNIGNVLNINSNSGNIVTCQMSGGSCVGAGTGHVGSGAGAYGGYYIYNTQIIDGSANAYLGTVNGSSGIFTGSVTANYTPTNTAGYYIQFPSSNGTGYTGNTGIIQYATGSPSVVNIGHVQDITAGGTIFTTGHLAATPTSNIVPLIVSGYSAGTADLVQVYNHSSGTNVFDVAYTGATSITAAGTGYTALSVYSQAGATVDPFDVYNPGSTSLKALYVDSYGFAHVQAIVADNISTINSFSGPISIAPGLDRIALTVNGYTGGSADLLDVYDQSGGRLVFQLDRQYSYLKPTDNYAFLVMSPTTSTSYIQMTPGATAMNFQVTAGTGATQDSFDVITYNNAPMTLSLVSQGTSYSGVTGTGICTKFVVGICVSF